tara:strand:- start:96 stop:497 length:402 start_codon:yes stop_codon:yes gene_type:complete
MVDSINVSATAPRTSTAPVASSGSAQSEPKPIVAESVIKPVDAVAKTETAASSLEQAKVSAENLQASVDQLNQLMKEGQRSLAFSVDESAGEVVVRVSDRQTNELIRQIPTEEALAIREHLDQVMGMLFSEKV